MSALSGSDSHGSSSVHIVTHCRQEHGIFVMSVPQIDGSYHRGLVFSMKAYDSSRYRVCKERSAHSLVARKLYFCPAKPLKNSSRIERFHQRKRQGHHSLLLYPDLHQL
jgi:hypothetical protein